MSRKEKKKRDSIDDGGLELVIGFGCVIFCYISDTPHVSSKSATPDSIYQIKSSIINPCVK